jgi:putative transposase
VVRRTWALRCRTPILLTRTRDHHRKVSTIGAIAISPTRRRVRAFPGFHREGSIRQAEIIEFLRDLLRRVRGRIIVVWDNLGSHKGKELRQWLPRCRRLHLEFLSPYAPELNPVEFLWSYIQCGPLANHCAGDVDSLHAHAASVSKPVLTEQRLLCSFIRGTKLPMRLKH